MFEALVITLREGVEATLVLAIAVSVLRRGGAAHLISALYTGALVALAASVGVAMLATHLTYNEELAEGIAKLVGAALVLSLTVWMWRSGPNMKREVESGLERATGGSGAFGVGLFAFGMVFREGVETAIFLSAAGFNSQGVGLWIGALAGLALAIVFGALFIRGTLRVPLKPFFSLTSAVLLLIAVQLLIGGLHELSEAQVLPSSRTEMALIGPIIKNELLLFTLTVALAAGWLLFGPSTRPTKAPAGAVDGPEARLERAERASERARRRWTGVVAVLVVGFLATAFVQNSRLPDRPPAQPLEITGDSLAFDAATLVDGHAHFFSVVLPGSTSGAAQSMRFFAIRTGDKVRTCFDACQICGDKGYFEDRGALVCRNCTSPISIASLGRSGGCNPIPLPSLLEGSRVAIGAAALEAVRPHLKGR
jgi:FTR1 family protein